MKWLARAVITVLLGVAPLSADPVGPIFTLLAEDAAGRWGRADGTGAGNDIVTAAYQAVGVVVQLDVMPYKRAKMLVIGGQSLGCFGMSWSDELQGKVAFPRNELYTNTATLLCRTADLDSYSSRTWKSGVVVGTVLGYEYPPSVLAFLEQQGARLEEAGTEVQNFRKLAAGRVDLVLANLDNLKSAESLMLDAGVQGQVVVARTLATSKTYVGFSSQDATARRAMTLFDRGMDKIRENGTLARILARWRAIAP